MKLPAQIGPVKRKNYNANANAVAYGDANWGEMLRNSTGLEKIQPINTRNLLKRAPSPTEVSPDKKP